LKNKLKRFEAVKNFSNFFQPLITGEFPLKGNWQADYFKNTNPIVLELGCGKGEYTVALAQRFPDKNFIGVDIKGSRMYVGAYEALQKGLKNVAFCRTKIDFINTFFSNDEIAEIWLTFSDPQPKKPNKRLSSPPFIQRYKQLLQQGGTIHLKTDSTLLFDYTQQQIIEHKYTNLLSTSDLYGELVPLLNAEMASILSIKTHYEQLFAQRGALIKYCKFSVS